MTGTLMCGARAWEGLVMSTAEIRFGIDGMSCAGCVSRAEKAIKSVSGIENAQVNLADASARVQVEDATAARAVAGALKSAGYPAMPRKLRLAIEGMTCASCVNRVETALKDVPGVLSVTVNLADGTATVTTLT